MIIRKGVWDENVCLAFHEDGDGSSIEESSISNVTAENKVECCRINTCDDCKNVSFLKMDIEGAELHALKGAEKVIVKNHPKLAICIYHTPVDMV